MAACNHQEGHCSTPHTRRFSARGQAPCSSGRDGEPACAKFVRGVALVLSCRQPRTLSAQHVGPALIFHHDDHDMVVSVWRSHTLAETLPVTPVQTSVRHDSDCREVANTAPRPSAIAPTNTTTIHHQGCRNITRSLQFWCSRTTLTCRFGEDSSSCSMTRPRMPSQYSEHPQLSADRPARTAPSCPATEGASTLKAG